ncbi:MAG: polysaccharide biosynthesis/export family protein [Calditrichaeota bacterium]|nr:polysaccharide biosynthesis/export family protein [Calditrichota bacterium]
MKRFRFVYPLILFLFLVNSSLFAKSKALSGYIIQPQSTNSSTPFKASDGILVDVFPDSNSFLNRVFQIDDRGYAEFPLAGKVNVARMSEKQLIDFIRKTYKIWMKWPNVYVKPVVRVSLLGGFTKPGLYYVDINSSLWDIVLEAGGPLKEDGVYEMHWQRNEDDETEDITKLFESGTSLRAMGFKSGDQIWTPSPDARTIWDTFGDILPVLTFATSIWLMYNTYQRDQIILAR